jgi:hypothetical protein
MTRAQAAAREIWSLDNGARQHQHAHCAQQARPPLLSRTASRACTLTAPGLSVRTVLRVVAVDLLRPRRLAADRAADGLHERCDIRATVDLQHDEQCVTASLPDAPGTAPQPSARRPRQHGDLVASLNRHVPGLVRLCSYRPDPTESHGIVKLLKENYLLDYLLIALISRFLRAQGRLSLLYFLNVGVS